MLIGVPRFMTGDADRSDAGGIIDALTEPENAFRRVIMIRERSFDVLDLNVLEPPLIQHFARRLRSAHAVLRRDGGIFAVGGADTGLRLDKDKFDPFYDYGFILKELNLTNDDLQKASSKAFKQRLLRSAKRFFIVSSTKNKNKFEISFKKIK